MAQLSITLNVVRRERCLNKIYVLVSEHVDGTQRLLPIVPSIGDIYHEGHLCPHRLAHIAHHAGAFPVIGNLQRIV